MALSQFEIAVGGITSVPVLAGSIYILYQTFGAKALDTEKVDKLKPSPKVSAKADDKLSSPKASS